MKKVPWNKYETVLLIDAYIQVSEGFAKRKDIVCQLSSDLRYLAILNGQIIDSQFRNVNGISMQMATIEYLFSKGEGGLSSYSKIFKEYTDLYKHNKTEFDAVLSEAKKRLEKIQSINPAYDTVLKSPEEADFNDPIDKEIIRIVKMFPDGIKAKEIAKRLSLERKVVNSHIYKNLKSFLEQDENYKWRLIKKHYDNSSGNLENSKGNTENAEESLWTVYNIDERLFKKVKVDNLSLKPATIENLHRNNIDTVGQLMSKSEKELRALRSIGNKKMIDIHNAVKKYFKISDNTSGVFVEESSKQSLPADIWLYDDKTISNALSIPNNERYSKIRIIDLNLPNRAENRLRTYNISTLSELLQTKVGTIKHFRGMGIGTLNKMAEELIKYSDNNSGNKKELVSIYSEELMEEFLNDKERTLRIKGAVRNALNSFLINTQIYEELYNIPSDYLTNNAKNYLNVFSDVFSVSLVEEQDYINCTLYQMIQNALQSEKVSKIELLEFIKCCNHKMDPKVATVIEQITSDPKAKIIISSRAAGKTLEEISKQFNVTRERIRQIEDKYRQIFIRYLTSNRFPKRMIADYNGCKLFGKEDFRTYFGDDLDIALYLSINKKDILYNKEFDIYSVEGKKPIEDLYNFLKSLPDFFNATQLKEKYNSSSISEDINYDFLLSIINDTYSLNGETYVKSALNYTKVYSAILERYYPKGLHITDPDEMNIFKEHIFETFGNIELPNNDRAIVAGVQRIAILCGRGKYKAKKNVFLPPELSNKIERYISKSKKAIYINAIFSFYERELLKCGIDNKYYLHGVLKELFGDRFYFKRDYVSNSPNIDSYADQIVNYILHAGTFVSKEELMTEFKGISEIMLQLGVADDEIINYFGEYLHGENLNIYPSDKRYFTSVIESMLKRDRVVSSDQIFNYIHNDRPDILERLGVFFSFSMFSVLKYLLDDQYSFQRPFIAGIGENIDRPVDVIYQYLSDKDIVEVDNFLETVAKARYRGQGILSTIVYFNNYHLLYNKHEMISIEKIGVTTEKVKRIENDILEQIGSKTRAIRDLNLNYSSFGLDMPISEWLIFSILQKYSSILETAAPGLFANAIPLVSLKGKMDVTVVAENKNSLLPGDVNEIEDDFDDLIIEMYEEELFGE